MLGSFRLGLQLAFLQLLQLPGLAKACAALA